jgi:hypothetical protein
MKTSGLAQEFIAYAVNSDQVARLCGVVFELGPQRGDVVVHRPGGGEALVPPHFIEQVVARDDLARASGQQAQDPEFLA